MQSDLGDCFSEIKKHLMQETKVCFIGTPCQVYGLKSYLRKEYDNLVTVDLGLPWYTVAETFGKNI